MNDFKELTAVVTGASAGFGMEFCKQLAPEVKHLVLVARRINLLENIKADLILKHPGLKIEIFQTDLGSEPATASLIKSLSDAGIKPDILINNAGLGDYGLIEGSDWHKINLMMQVNMRAVTQLTHAMLPHMLQNKRGYILNVSSIAGFMPIPSFAVYAASKSYVTSMTESMHSELIDTGVHITALCPGPSPTEFGTVANRANCKRAFNTSNFLSIPPQTVVRCGLEALAANKCICIPGLMVRFLMWIVRWMPTPISKLIRDIAAVRAAKVERSHGK